MFSRLIAFAALAVPALSLSIPNVSYLQKRADGLTVELSSGSGSQVNAKLTNGGADTLNLLNYGTFMDESKVQKVTVYKDCKELVEGRANHVTLASAVGFNGVMKNYMISNIPEGDFTSLAPGESFETSLDIAALHEVSDGEYTVDSTGSIPFANPGSTELVGAAPYSSNTLTVKLSGTSKTKRAYEARRDALNELDKRVVLTSSCSGSLGTTTRTALSDAVSLANTAAASATAGSASEFQTYFKTTSSSTRTRVNSVYRSVASQAGSTTSGSVTLYCEQDVYNDCGGNVLAYTVPSASVVVICALSYNELPVLTNSCHAQDLTTTIIHEFTHALAGTQDYAYGYSAATALPASEAVANADTCEQFSPD
ncbi:MAG: hypothetical protein Q9227_008617 [Pyrenula ochraceoflavens]